MVVRELVERFAEQAPVCVMVRAALENVFAAERLDAMFEKTARQQRSGELLFSTVADMMAAVVCQIRPSVHAAYRAQADEIGVTIKAVYDKLGGIEPAVSRGMVQETGQRMRRIIEKMGTARRELLPGYRAKILDGNHLRRTDRRIGELREINGAPLPGQALVVLDPQWKMVADVIPCEDGHAQERSLLPQILETVQRGEVWIADRNFCTAKFLFGIMARRAHFIIREHATSPPRERVGRRRKVGRCRTGVVYEQNLRIWDDQGNEKILRRITVELYEPTRDGETEIHILTNLPKKVTPLTIAEVYGNRWTIETAFQEMAENLDSEIQTLGYPKAALFGFCMGLVVYNILSVVKAAIRAAHGEDAAEKISTYYMADEIAGTYRGMMIAVGETYWSKQFANLTPARMARTLIGMARHIQLSRYAKNSWRPKKKPDKQMNKKNRSHISTARILEKRNPATKPVKC
jgi:IS4 transposase